MMLVDLSNSFSVRESIFQAVRKNIEISWREFGGTRWDIRAKRLASSPKRKTRQDISEREKITFPFREEIAVF